LKAIAINNIVLLPTTIIDSHLERISRNLVTKVRPPSYCFQECWTNFTIEIAPSLDAVQLESLKMG